MPAGDFTRFVEVGIEQPKILMRFSVWVGPSTKTGKLKRGTMFMWETVSVWAWLFVAVTEMLGWVI